MQIWYFVDRGQNRQGPVDAAVLAEAVRQGQLDETSLVWREGLSQWSPLGQFRDELGLGDSLRPPPPAAPASAAAAPAAAKSNKGCLIAAIVVIGGFFLIMVLGIVAAIALPAYQDYVVRSKVALVMVQAEAAKEQVSSFVANTDRCPRDAAELQLQPPQTPGLAALEVMPLGGGVCVIELTLAALPGAEDLEDGRIYLRREEDGTWSCTSDLARQSRLPTTCR